MTVVTVGIIGIMTVLMAVQLKSLKGEYGLYLVLAAACVIFFYGTLRLKGILDGLQDLKDLAAFQELERLYQLVYETR